MFKHFFDSNLGKFRLIAIMEGISYLFLLCIAMPLKYKFGFELAVKYTGWMHGILFVAYGIFLLIVWKQYKWSFKKVIFAFTASLIPFGTFVFDKQLRNDNSEKK